MSKIDEILKELETNTINFTIKLLSDPKQEITFRPIKTKDQKVLSVENEENKDSSNPDLKNFKTILKLVDSVILKNKIPIGDLEIPDFVWLLLNIRAKSLGEVLELVGTCHNCKEKLDVNIDILRDYSKKEKKTINSKIRVNNNISVELGVVTVEDLYLILEKPDTERDTATVASLIKKVEYMGEIMEFGLEEKIKIIEELSKEVLEKIDVYANDVEYGIKLEKKYKCPKCFNENKFTFNSYEIINFF